MSVNDYRMISIPLKDSSEVDFFNPLQKVISIIHGNKSRRDFTGAIEEFDQLRKNALCITLSEKDEGSLELMYRYYDQLNVLSSKIPNQNLDIPFDWKDAFSTKTFFRGKHGFTLNTLAYEKYCVLFNIGALQSSVAASQSFDSDDGPKLAATLFRSAAGIFEHLKSSPLLAIHNEPTSDMRYETLDALVSLMMAQAQESLVIKALHTQAEVDSIAELAAQTEGMYDDALELFLDHLWQQEDHASTMAAKQAGYKAMSEFYHSLMLREVGDRSYEIARLMRAVEFFKDKQLQNCEGIGQIF